MKQAPPQVNKAWELLKRNQIEKAVQILKGVLQREPMQPDALELLAGVAHGSKRYDAAVGLVKKAMVIRPNSPALHARMGMILCDAGKPQEAAKHLERSLQFEPRKPMTHFYLGRAQRALGEYNEAGKSFQRVMHLKPDYVEAYYQFGLTAQIAKKHNAAMAAFQKAAELAPERTDILVDLGNSLRALDRDEVAEKHFHRALEIDPNTIGALNNLSNILRDRKEIDQAESLGRRAIEAAPNHPILHNGLGLSLKKQGRFDEARESYLKAIELNPNYANAHYNLGNLVQEFRELDEAETCFKRALELDPNHTEARFHLGTLDLLKGDLEKGFEEYEIRFETDEAAGTERTFDKPQWDGNSPQGKTILVHTEQGHGDSLQFIRYLPLLKERGATVVLECSKRLVRLFSNCEGIDQIVGRDDGPLPEFDYFVPLMSLPHLLGTTLETIPANVPYLFPEEELLEKWRERLADIPGLKVGIGWQGKPSYLRDEMRSVPVTEFAPLAEVEGVSLISLQKWIGFDRPDDLGIDFPLIEIGDELDNGPDAFIDTAAAIKNLDLIVCSDTSLPHLAGALGAPVWLATGYMPEWRWLLDRNDSPWYPTMKLFRQPAINDWAGAFAQMKQELANLAAGVPTS